VFVKGSANKVPPRDAARLVNLHVLTRILISGHACSLILVSGLENILRLDVFMKVHPALFEFCNTYPIVRSLRRCAKTPHYPD
jgi:hypothetical protein